MQESDLLNDIETSSKRTFIHTTALKRQVDEQLGIIGDLEEGMDDGVSALQTEASRARQVTMDRNSGFCWMYTLILIESVSLIAMVWNGL
jgi:hypothetical protein